MTAPENKALLRRFFDEAVNRQDLNVLDEIISPAFRVTPDEPAMQGPGGMRRFLRRLFGILPDLRYSVEDVIAEGDRVVARARAHGTHRGEYLGYAGTGLPVEYGEILIFRVAEGQIAEWWLELDQLGILRQIGAFPGA